MLAESFHLWPDQSADAAIMVFHHFQDDHVNSQLAGLQEVWTNLFCRIYDPETKFADEVFPFKLVTDGRPIPL